MSTTSFPTDLQRMSQEKVLKDLKSVVFSLLNAKDQNTEGLNDLLDVQHVHQEELKLQNRIPDIILPWR